MMFFLDDPNLELSDLAIYFYETNFFHFTPEKKEVNDLFTYLVNRGYIQEAADLWDNIINSKPTLQAS
jgi:hypothetical protein